MRKETMARGPPMTLLSHYDESQTYLLVADGEDNVIWIVRRGDGTIVERSATRAETPASFITCTRSLRIPAGICTRVKLNPADGFRSLCLFLGAQRIENGQELESYRRNDLCGSRLQPLKSGHLISINPAPRDSDLQSLWRACRQTCGAARGT